LSPKPQKIEIETDRKNQAWTNMAEGMEMSLPGGDVEALPGLLGARELGHITPNRAHSAQQEPSQRRILTPKARTDSQICPKSFARCLLGDDLRCMMDD
jgi:hypothetical protein